MGKRAEIRRSQREARKALKGGPPPAFPAFVDIRSVPRQEVANHLGIELRLLDEWTTQQREDMYKAFCQDFNEKLYDAENYVSLANILISCVAIHMTWGYTKAIGRYVKNLNAASQYVKKQGLEKTFNQVCKEYDLDLEFDSFDVEDFIQKMGKEGQTA